MTRTALDERLCQLVAEVLTLGSMVEQSAKDSVAALRHHDTAWARKIEARDQLINTHRFTIERGCLALIATQQPMAHDLRILAAVLEVITDIERMGDYIKGIAHIIPQLHPEPLPRHLPDRLDSMAEHGNSMLHRALTAFAAGDEQAARAIPAEDDLVDELYGEVYHELAEGLTAHPESVDHYTRLFWVAHNLERFADRVSNICERTIFTATGEIMEFSTSGGD
ncbi:MAG: phosphate signaling complex protein PhoU [Anaerolineales bacterium]|nr:phosphate signaling complex protein PhoU [Anaerolineales bacterium]